MGVLTEDMQRVVREQRLGFVATVQLTSALFMKQSMKLFTINTGYQLVCYLIMSAILTVWR